MSDKSATTGDGIIVDALFRCGECNGAGTVQRTWSAPAGHIGCRIWTETCTECWGSGFEGEPFAVGFTEQLKTALEEAQNG